MKLGAVLSWAIWFLAFMCEPLVITSTGTISAARDSPPKHKGINYYLKPEVNSNDENLPSKNHDVGFEMKRNVNEDVLKQSRIMEYIENIRANSTLRADLCNKAQDRTIVLNQFGYKFQRSSYQKYKTQAKNGHFVARYLTNLFENYANLSLKSLNDEHVPAIITLLRITVKEDTNIAGGGIAFGTNFFPYIYKTGNVTTEPTDLAQVYKNFTIQDFYAYHARKTFAHSGILSSTSDKTIDDDDVMAYAFWGSPYYDCFALKRWIIPLSYPFYGRLNGSNRFMGVVLLDIDLEESEINQCDNSNSLFAGSHKCSQETTKCQYTPGKKLELGSYECHCKHGFYFPVSTAPEKFYIGTLIEHYFLESLRKEVNLFTSDFQCLPCHQGCIHCNADEPCYVEYNILMRGIPLGIQSFCMTVTIVLGFVIIRVRKCKVMVIGMWCLLEFVLLGSLFLYATVVVQYFEPSTMTCLLVPWLRELGFAILYGALVLKIYRLLADFQSRKAHRVHFRDKDLLKYLLCIVVAVITYMAAWTAIQMDQVQDGILLLETGLVAHEELKYLICKSGWWDYSTEAAEVLFLVFGIYLCYRVRAAPSEYNERTYISAAICFEGVISTAFYVLRHIYWKSLHPDYLFLMYFLRCQLTVTITQILVFGPKLWYAHRPIDDRQIRNRAYSSSDVPDNMTPEAMKLNVGISSNGDIDTGDISLADMDPEDIKVELKRLYTQLQVYKTRNMRKDNPHISKRRGGRKQTHRRFSLQAFHHKHRHHHDHELEISKTPEESTISAEGLPMEMTVTRYDEINEKPMSFKMCYAHK